MPRKKAEPVDVNDVNKRIMNEIGLEPGDNRYLVDQDTGDVLKFNGKFILPIEDHCARDAIPFDPVNNVKLMNRLFAYYAQKQENEGEEPIHAFYPVPCETDPKKGYIEVKDESNNITRSKAYNSDSLKYADVLCQLNGDNNVDFTMYDMERPIVRKRKTRE